ncbi:MAG: HupE/UreJ family protein [bacterium]
MKLIPPIVFCAALRTEEVNVLAMRLRQPSFGRNSGEKNKNILDSAQRAVGAKRLLARLFSASFPSQRAAGKTTFSLLILLLAFVSGAFAHETRPAYLELRQTGPETYETFWKAPAMGDNMRLGINVELPPDCQNVTPPRATIANNAFTQRWTVKRNGGLTGTEIRIAGLAVTVTDVLVRIERLDGSTQITRLTPASPSFIVEAAPNVFEVARTFTVLGVEHILTGIDHLMFVLSLLIITAGGWRLVKTVTAFTLSHSLTLTAATLGWIHILPKPVEAVIALSIVFVAAEIIQMRRGNVGISASAPWVVAFAFGLIHGLGFASGLSEAGLPTAPIPAARLFFSLGVEIGHLLFIGSVFALTALAREALKRFKMTPPIWSKQIPPYAIGGIAAFWFIQRIAAF